MAVKINQYKFGKICGEMGQKFGRIQKGEEQGYEPILFPMESNVLKVHRNHPSSSGRRMSEAVSLVLFQVKQYLTGEEYDLSTFESEDNKRLVQALLMAFDPFTNEDIRDLLGKSYDLEDKEVLTEYYKNPILCLIRLKESVDFWENEGGLNGYFAFIESTFGATVPNDEEFDYTICAEEKKGGLFGRFASLLPPKKDGVSKIIDKSVEGENVVLSDKTDESVTQKKSGLFDKIKNKFILHS